ncbi:MAG TPA: NAD-dependent epimerase/dehydratase family protein, partial [Myxococcota bacterium]|nr:NAD-dependent epimerase/dehydratase family protein [Myxococcota bacterium]
MSISAAMVAVGADDLEHVHGHMEGRWEALRRRDVLITGGTGFFGKWLLESWVSAQERFGLGGTAWVVSRDPEAFLRVMPHLRGQASLRFVRGDVQGLALPPEARFSHVIHAATQASAALNQDAPLQMLDTIVAGTRRVLELARERGAEAFLLTSSGAVYGRQPADLHHIPETFTGGPDPLDPGAAYGEGKRLAESLCAAFGRAHGLACKIARCFAFVGPHLPLDTHFAAGNFLRDGQAGGPIRVGGDGT